MNTKLIARLTGFDTKAVNALIRDLDIPMSYDHNCRCWRVEDEQTGREIIHFINMEMA